MKSKILLFLLIPFACISQFNRKALIKYSILFNAGIIQGSHEANLAHYSTFKRVHHISDADDWFYNPQVSWKNKWQPHSTSKELFLGSSTIFVQFTDFYHLSKFSYISAMTVGFTIYLGRRQKFKDILVESLIGAAVQKVGFLISYNLIYSTK